MSQKQEAASTHEAPITQERKGFRQNWPVWMRQMPRFKFPAPNENFQLIDTEQLGGLLAESDPNAAEAIRADIKHMDYELLRLFRKLDHEAKLQQNRYRFFQIAYIVLAFFATLLGSFLALALDSRPALVPWLAFAETIIALLTAFLATISGREPPLPLWMSTRRRAEALRREYFRYLLNLSPYDEVAGYKREMLLSSRAAAINRGVFASSDAGRP